MLIAPLDVFEVAAQDDAAEVQPPAVGLCCYPVRVRVESKDMQLTLPLRKVFALLAKDMSKCVSKSKKGPDNRAFFVG